MTGSPTELDEVMKTLGLAKEGLVYILARRLSHTSN